MGGSFLRVFRRKSIQHLPNGDGKYLWAACQAYALVSPFLHNKFLIFPLAFLTEVMYYIEVS